MLLERRDSSRIGVTLAVSQRASQALTTSNQALKPAVRLVRSSSRRLGGWDNTPRWCRRGSGAGEVRLKAGIDLATTSVDRCGLIRDCNRPAL
jgi:hypothetical protein